MSAAPAPSSDLPVTPCPLPRELLDDMQYDPGPYMLRELLELDPGQSLVRLSLASDAGQPITASQRVARDHPAHVAGALIVHLTGAAGFVHAYYLLGLRRRNGWVGYGTHIHRAVFRRLITPGADMQLSCRATRVRPGRDRYMVRYDLELRSDGARCYQGDQSAAWMRVAR
jgi:3-hydroxymyristoyl/3-hydroxydecanoyl-(acyl carrier protein) dehydratase